MYLEDAASGIALKISAQQEKLRVSRGQLNTPRFPHLHPRLPVKLMLQLSSRSQLSLLL